MENVFTAIRETTNEGRAREKYVSCVGLELVKNKLAAHVAEEKWSRQLVFSFTVRLFNI